MRQTKIAAAIESLHLTPAHSTISLGSPTSYGICCVCAAMTGDGYKTRGIAATVKTTILGNKWNDRFLCGGHLCEVRGVLKKRLAENSLLQKPPRDFHDRKKTCTEVILEILDEKPGVLYSRNLILSLAEKDGYWFHGSSYRHVFKTLRENNAIIERQVYGCLHYRMPLKLKEGWFVVENIGKKSQRFGWVETFINEFPVVRWKDLSRSISSDDLLDYLDNFLIVKELKVIRDIYQGNVSDEFKAIPWYLFDGLASWHKNGKLRSIDVNRLLEIAKFLKFVPQNAKGLQARGSAYRETIEYLNTWYPNWKREEISLSAMSVVEEIRRNSA